MKKIGLLFVTGFLSQVVSAQLVAKVEVKENIAGICNKNEVYALFHGFKGQEEAVCPISKSDILTRLNNEVTFLKDKPKYKDKGMVFIMINCNGKVIQCEIDVKTKDAELDKQIIEVFNSLGEWKTGKLDGKAVDSSQLFSFKIKNGRFEFD